MSGETIGMLLAITSGMLSLVGLISIFISMNSQHNVQRSREILWSIFTLPYKKNLFLEKGAIGQEVFRTFLLYEQIINEKNTFLRRIISFAQITLTFCGLIWTTIVGYLLKQSFSSVERSILLFCVILADIFVLYFIIKIFGLLTSTSKVGRLPTVNELLDADILTAGSNVITLASVSSQLKIVNSEVYIGFPIPFKNLMVHISIQDTVESSESPVGKNYNFDLVNGIKDFKKLDYREFKLLDDDYCYYPIYDLSAFEKGVAQNSIFAKVELLSKQGYVSTEFYFDGLLTVNNANFVIYPYSFIERFINRKSELDPFSRYIKRSGKSIDNETEWFNTGKSFLALFDEE
ncbi:hypothetical protein [Desulfosporosinus sp.]|uniref:hypothetical protein n=1 Tax=Desulfosporosinus sp. TaxID=157907 RepID=UPI002313AB83|nr:hypothetical protein [Desulfosporosinus sp.]MCO5384468.1 hypothetical protein [Desulfosporosinus sp.]MDA8221981.1 hypothetical protein [Desulfitobacterium hafniense]